MPCREATASVIGAFLGNDKHHLLIVLSRQVGLARQGFGRYLIITKKTTKDNADDEEVTYSQRGRPTLLSNFFLD